MNCKNIILFCFLCFFAKQGVAVQYGYRINFTDKNGTPFSLSSPNAYLSPRAILRRTNQSISIDSLDLPVNNWYVDSVLHVTGGFLHEVSKWENFCVILVSDSAVIHSLSGISFIKSTQFVSWYPAYLHYGKQTISTVNTNQTCKTASKTTSDASYYGQTWQQTSVLNANYLHDLGDNGAGKMIAVLDAGFIGTDTHYGFTTLRTAGRIVDTHNFTLDTSFVYESDTHGTSVLSTMAGYVPDTFVGAAPMAMYALYITEDDNSEQMIEPLNLLCGTERADSMGADIITSSLGYNTFDNPVWNYVFSTDFDGKTTVPANAVNIASRKGIIFFSSAGNEGGDAWNKILTPGDADSALTIGNVGASLTPASNSGYGPNAASQIKPDVCGVGFPANVFSSTGLSSEQGTSFSTPQIAGWAACLWEGNPSASPYQVKQAIRMCASLYAAPTTQMGYGIPNFECAANTLNVKDTPHPFYDNNWIIVYPNPCGNKCSLQVTPDVSGNISFSICDVTGKVVISETAYFYKGSNPLFEINNFGIPSGIYFLKAAAAKKTITIKLVKE